MADVVIICADGFEEVEALAVADILRRGAVKVDLVSINEGSLNVVGSHQIQIVADRYFERTEILAAAMVVLPGGVRGTENLAQYKPLLEVLNQLNAETKIGAICAAPSVLAQEGLLDHKKATSNPSYMEAMLKHPVNYSQEAVVMDGKITTSRGMGTTIPFALELLKQLKGEKIVEQVKQTLVYDSLVDFIKNN